jgi:hypothetical protein
MEDLASVDLHGPIRRQRHRGPVLLFEQHIPIRRLADFLENLGHCPFSALDPIRSVIDENGDHFLVGGDEALQAGFPQIDFLVRLHDIVLAVGKFFVLL